MSDSKLLMFKGYIKVPVQVMAINAKHAVAQATRAYITATENTRIKTNLTKRTPLEPIGIILKLPPRPVRDTDHTTETYNG